MLSPKRRKQWLNATWRLSIVWIVSLAIGYILYYGWMGWPTVVIREDIPFIGEIHLDWWLFFILQAIFPGFLSVIAFLIKRLSEKAKEKYKYIEQDATHLIIAGVLIIGIIFLLAMGLIGTIIANIIIFGGIIGHKKYRSQIRWLIGK